jgi:hypothetical protein
VIVTGRDVFVPNESGGEACTSFATTRFVRAATDQEAIECALELVRVAWREEAISFDSPPPSLSVAFSAKVMSPLKRSCPNSGWCFATNETSLSDAVEIEKEASAGWFL